MLEQCDAKRKARSYNFMKIMSSLVKMWKLCPHDKQGNELESGESKFLMRVYFLARVIPTNNTSSISTSGRANLKRSQILLLFFSFCRMRVLCFETGTAEQSKKRKHIQKTRIYIIFIPMRCWCSATIKSSMYLFYDNEPDFSTNLSAKKSSS